MKVESLVVNCFLLAITPILIMGYYSNISTYFAINKIMNNKYKKILFIQLIIPWYCAYLVLFNKIDKYLKKD